MYTVGCDVLNSHGAAVDIDSAHVYRYVITTGRHHPHHHHRHQPCYLANITTTFVSQYVSAVGYG